MRRAALLLLASSLASAQEVTLRLSVDDVKVEGYVRVHKVLEDWDEATLTYANRPALGPELARFEVTRADDGEWREVVLPPDVAVALLADDLGAALAPETANVWFGSRESGSPVRVSHGSLIGDVVADTYVSSETPSTPLGAAQDLKVQPWSSRVAYLRFPPRENNVVVLTPRIESRNDELLVTLSWETDPPADFCEGFGDWSGTLSATGAEQVSGTSFGLRCLWSNGFGPMPLAWTPPDQNVDGTPLTDLAGYVVWSAPRGEDGQPGAYTQVLTIDEPDASSWLLSGQSATPRWWALQAYNEALVSSAMSVPVLKGAETDDTVVETVTITINGVPSAPSVEE